MGAKGDSFFALKSKGINEKKFMRKKIDGWEFGSFKYISQNLLG